MKLDKVAELKKVIIKDFDMLVNILIQHKKDDIAADIKSIRDTGINFINNWSALSNIDDELTTIVYGYWQNQDKRFKRADELYREIDEYLHKESLHRCDRCFTYSNNDVEFDNDLQCYLCEDCYYTLKAAEEQTGEHLWDVDDGSETAVWMKVHKCDKCFTHGRDVEFYGDLQCYLCKDCYDDLKETDIPADVKVLIDIIHYTENMLLAKGYQRDNESDNYIPVR